MRLYFMSKICFKCGIEKELSEFYKHKQMADGHVNKCKECNKKDVRENRSKNIDYYQEYDRKRANLPHRVDARKEYAKTTDGWANHVKGKMAWAHRNPIKVLASQMVNNAVRDGKLIKTDCEWCGRTDNIHGHHCDYAKPLDVMWLCAQCHRDWHKKYEAINGDMPDEDEIE
jgi:hypothetical protein